MFSGGNIVKDTGDALDKLFTSDEERMEKKLEIQKATQEFQLAEDKLDVQLATGQQEINKIEAANPNMFVAGWRPAVGWICVLGLAYQFLGYPLFCWITAWRHFNGPVPPALPGDVLMTLLFGMLGLGGFRTYEKIKGADTKVIGNK
ncbi:MAG TPA: hypothetical protein DCQ83_02625 [Fibrobacteres bacterium]|nr:hypothetical protein [Fibrobacterota bacterium]